MSDNAFVRLASINVNDKVEKKANLSYLSWAWAVDQLMRADAAANWEYGEPKLYGETMMVFCTVTAFGKAMTAHLPVMDHRNKPIPNPDAFQVNTAMQRALVKAIALHGLGLYIYAGEDLPEGGEKDMKEISQERQPETGITPTGGAWESLTADMHIFLTDIANNVRMLLHKKDIAGAWDELTQHDTQLDEHAKVGLWSRFDSKERSALKEEAAKRKQPKVAA